MRLRSLLALAALSLASLAPAARAAALPVLDHALVEGRPTLYLANPYDQPLELVELVTRFGDERYQLAEDDLRIAPHEGLVIPLGLSLPARPGTHPITSWLTYKYGDEPEHVVDVDLVDVGTAHRIGDACSATNAQFTRRGALHVESPAPDALRLVLPSDVQRDDRLESEAPFSYPVHTASRSGLQSRPYFGVVEYEMDGANAAGICQAFLTSGLPSRTLYARGRIPSAALVAMTLLFGALAVSRRSAADRGDREARALVMWSSRMALLAAGYLFMKDVDLVFASLDAWLPWAPAQTVFEEGVLHMRSPYLLLFFRFADVYVAVCAVLGWSYFRRSDDGTPLERDKYVALVSACVPRQGNGWNEAARLGGKVALIKLFFVPLAVSWSIGHTLAIPGLIADLRPRVDVIADFLMRLCFLVDTTVFAFGYVVESKRLGSEIRSVDPHWLGWFVCIACYPPFDAFTFDPFAIGTPHAIHGPAWLVPAMTVATLSLWMFYTSASVALGPKASNLTHRGIVERGPYRLVRHPAYGAKLTLWLIDVAYFGKAPLFQWLGFALFYVARAWSEERHLRADPDYEAYRKRVRWWFIPGVL